MKDKITRLLITVLNYPDNLGAAFARATVRRDTVWDKVRLMIARKM